MNDNDIDEKRLITVASGKGGVGKTWLSITLSHAMGSLGKDILLFDGDLGLANVDIQLGLMPEQDLGLFISGDRSLKDVVAPYRDSDQTGFDVIPGRSGSGALGNLNENALTRLRSGLIDMTQYYDRVVLDLAAGIDQSVTTLSTHKGTVLVVMTGDPTSLTDAYAFIKLAYQRDPATDIRIAVNNVKSKQVGEKAYDAIRRACEGFLKMTPPLAGIVRQDDRVVDSIRAQVPILTRHPQSEAAADVKKLAETLLKG